MQKITPFLWFDREAEEAAKFYVSVFKRGKITGVSRYAEGAPVPAGTVMTVEFELFGQPYTALNGGPLFKFNESFSFVVHCRTQREIDYYWKKLTAGGGRPVQCGWLKDRFGLSWQIVPAGLAELFDARDPARAARVMKVLMKMTKLDLHRLRRAAGGKRSLRRS